MPNRLLKNTASFFALLCLLFVSLLPQTSVQAAKCNRTALSKSRSQWLTQKGAQLKAFRRFQRSRQKALYNHRVLRGRAIVARKLSRSQVLRQLQRARKDGRAALRARRRYRRAVIAYNRARRACGQRPLPVPPRERRPSKKRAKAKKKSGMVRLRSKSSNGFGTAFQPSIKRRFFKRRGPVKVGRSRIAGTGRRRGTKLSTQMFEIDMMINNLRKGR